MALRLIWPSRLALLVCVLVCVVAPVSLVTAHVLRTPTFSIVDEEAHFDYVQRVAGGSVPRLGQQILPSTNRLVRCLGRPPEAFTLPPCHGASRLELSRFYHSIDNAQYEAQQPPLYYALTAVLRWPLIHALGMTALTGTRFTGAIWLAAGLLLLWIAGRVLRIEWPIVAAGVLFIAATPNVVFEASVVSNDGAAIFAGALVALLGAAVWRWPGVVPWWAFAITGLLVTLLKVSFALPVVLVAALLAVWFLCDSTDSALPRSRRAAALRWLPTGGAMLLGAVVGAIGWSAVFHALALVNPKTFAPFRLAADGRTGIADLGTNALAMLFPFTSSPAPQFQWTGSGIVPSTSVSLFFQSFTSDATAFLVMAASFSWLFVRDRSWSHWTGLASALTLFFGGWLLGVSILFTYNYNSSLPGRYGLPLGVFLVLALIGSLKGESARRVFTLFSAATFVLAFLYILV